MYVYKTCLLQEDMINLELVVFQNANTPMLQSKLPHLKNLEIGLGSSYPTSSYDVVSLVSFLDAAPALESFILRVSRHPHLSYLYMVLLMYYTWLLEVDI